MNSHIFREYDIRGIAETDLSDADVAIIGRASAPATRGTAGNGGAGPGCAAHLAPHRKGPDRRAQRLGDQRGRRRRGADAGPLLRGARLEDGRRRPVTGSHNPSEFNGFKMDAGEASMYGGEIQELRHRREAREFATGHGRRERTRCRSPSTARMLAENITWPAAQGRHGRGQRHAPARRPGHSSRDIGLHVSRCTASPTGAFRTTSPTRPAGELIEDLVGAGHGDRRRSRHRVRRRCRPGRRGRRKGRIVWGDQLLCFARPMSSRASRAPRSSSR